MEARFQVMNCPPDGRLFPTRLICYERGLINDGGQKVVVWNLHHFQKVGYLAIIAPLSVEKDQASLEGSPDPVLLDAEVAVQSL